MAQFWRHGYAGTSIADLVEATGVNRYSLYASWGDKRGLFLAALARYGATMAGGPVHTLASGGVAGIRTYFHTLAAWVHDDATKLGCFTVNSIVDVAGADDDARAVVRHNLDLVRSAFVVALTGAVDQGELPLDTDVDAHADHLAVSIQAVLLQARSGASRQTLDHFVQLTLSTLPESP